MFESCRDRHYLTIRFGLLEPIPYAAYGRCDYKLTPATVGFVQHSCNPDGCICFYWKRPTPSCRKCNVSPNATTGGTRRPGAVALSQRAIPPATDGKDKRSLID
jgi:hypothetical protein